MGYIKSSCMRLTRNGFKKSWDITAVREEPGQHEWVTTVALGSYGKPVRFANPDHKPFRVFGTKQEARRDHQAS